MRSPRTSMAEVASSRMRILGLEMMLRDGNTLPLTTAELGARVANLVS